MSRVRRQAIFIFSTSVIVFSVSVPANANADASFNTDGTDTLTTLSTQQSEFERTRYPRELEARAAALEGVPGLLTNAHMARVEAVNSELSAALLQEPRNTVPAAKAQLQAQSTAAGNSAADVARDQAIAAIDYASRFLRNFTSEKNSKWNQLRDNIFVPIAILLLLPGAALAQVRAIVAAGNPVIGHVSPFEGIQRTIIAVFLIPGSYLVVNYSIDLANSIQFTISSEYKRLFGSDMYQDAICAEIRAFGVRYIAENEGSLQTPPPDLSATGHGPFSAAEGRLWGKLVDPCAGVHVVPKNRDDSSMPASTIATRLMMNMSNAGINTGWAILCAFQMAFFYYLYFVGPIMAALWVWPIKALRDAFPSWVEGVITLCFWSLFWHTTILLMACLKGTDDSGLFIMSALNFLATACVKHSFDFAGLVRSAGQKAGELAEKAGQSDAAGGGSRTGQSPAAASGSGSGNAGTQAVDQAEGSTSQIESETTSSRFPISDSTVDRTSSLNFTDQGPMEQPAMYPEAIGLPPLTGGRVHPQMEWKRSDSLRLPCWATQTSQNRSLQMLRHILKNF